MYCTLSLKDLSSHILLVAHSWTRKLRISSRHCFKVKASLYYVSSICCKTTQRTEAATPTRACQLVKGGMPLSGAQRADTTLRPLFIVFSMEIQWDPHPRLM